MPSNHTRPTAAAAPSPGPADGSHFDMPPFARRLLAASVSPMTAASRDRVPNFYPVSTPIGAILLYLLMGGVGVWAAGFLAMLATDSPENDWMAVVPVVIFGVEFGLIPILKYPAYLSRSLAAMRAYITDNRKVKEAFEQKSRAWHLQDWVALLILTASLCAKIAILVQYGTYLPAALLSFNYIVALADYAAHLNGVTSKLPYFVLARTINFVHLRRRLHLAAAQAIAEGRDELEALAFRFFTFKTGVEVPEDSVGPHEIRALGSGWYKANIAGTLDDAERAAFLHRAGDNLKRAALAQALARIQLELLDAPEMLAGHAPAEELGGGDAPVAQT